ncbi:hypothetical protein [Lactimicrobium massiliense]|uniref:hypothetical protein n=1 Tax=Lactimicrobium massiliense TaxID=2161814 RepID=UPI00107F29EF|nr:hypothetical protein [Lactimicrobium massiliense]
MENIEKSVELRSASPDGIRRGKLEGIWYPEHHCITIRNPHTRLETKFMFNSSNGTVIAVSHKY